MDEILRAIFEFLVDLFMNSGGGMVIPAVIWAAGAFLALWPLTGTTVASGGLIVAFCVALWLTYLWSHGSKAARNVLLAGSLVGLAAVAAGLISLRRAA